MQTRRVKLAAGSGQPAVNPASRHLPAASCLLHFAF